MANTNRIEYPPNIVTPEDRRKFRILRRKGLATGTPVPTTTTTPTTTPSRIQYPSNIKSKEQRRKYRRDNRKKLAILNGTVKNNYSEKVLDLVCMRCGSPEDRINFQYLYQVQVGPELWSVHESCLTEFDKRYLKDRGIRE